MFQNITNHIGKPICIKYRCNGEELIDAGILTSYNNLEITINNEKVFSFCDQNIIIIAIVNDNDEFLYRIEDLEEDFEFLLNNYKPANNFDGNNLCSIGIKEINIDTLPEWIEFTNKHSNNPILIAIVISILKKINAGMKPKQAEILTCDKEYHSLLNDEYKFLIETNVSKFIQDDYLQAQYIDYLNNLYGKNQKKLVLELNGENPCAYEVDRFKKRSN